MGRPVGDESLSEVAHRRARGDWLGRKGYDNRKGDSVQVVGLYTSCSVKFFTCSCEMNVESFHVSGF